MLFFLSEHHDEAGQALTALKLSLELIQAELPHDAGAPRQNLTEAIALTEATTERIRLLALCALRRSTPSAST